MISWLRRLLSRGTSKNVGGPARPQAERGGPAPPSEPAALGQIEPRFTGPRPPALTQGDPPECSPPDRAQLVWLEHIPGALLFVDVETTGLHSSDRVVSVACILLKKMALADRALQMSYAHIVCDPGKKSHPKGPSLCPPSWCKRPRAEPLAERSARPGASWAVTAELR